MAQGYLLSIIHALNQLKKWLTMNNAATQNHSTQNSAQTAPDNTSRALITLLQLGRRARAAKTLEELGFITVNETLQLISYRQAGLFLTLGSDLGVVRLTAVSGTPNPDPNAPFIQWLSQVGRHLHSRTKSGEEPAYSGSSHVVNIAAIPELLSADWSQWLPKQALWLPLKAADQTIGGLLMAREEPWQAAEMLLIDELGQVYQHAAHALKPRRAWQLNLRDKLKPTRSKLWVAAAILVVAFFPVRLSVLAPAEVVPREPFLVRAPLDGVIETVDVRPNQVVTAQTPLFSLDTTTLKSQHAIALQAFDTAQEEYRQAAQLAVTDDKGKLEMSLKQGTMAEKSVELNYTAEQLSRVQVKAERDGVAVFNDVNDLQGKAVTIGEKILLLADPNNIELNIDLPASDIIALEPGAKVKLYPSASPITSYNATVLTIAYHAEPTAKDVLAYRIKAEFDEANNLPRLGMMGTAKISGGYVPFSYYLLRKPWAATRLWLGW